MFTKLGWGAYALLIFWGAVVCFGQAFQGTSSYFLDESPAVLFIKGIEEVVCVYVILYLFIFPPRRVDGH